MTFVQFVFYCFATVSVLSGLMVVASPNPVRGALFLVLTFFAMAGVWMLLEAEFLSLILVLVYVGAVMTLFLFVVMMLRTNTTQFRQNFVRFLPLALIVTLLVLVFMLIAIDPKHMGQSASRMPEVKPADYNNIRMLGFELYAEYVYPFEIAGVMLLAAIVAAISLSHRKPKDRKMQNPSQQVAVKRRDRVKLINLPSENPSKPTLGDIP